MKGLGEGGVGSTVTTCKPIDNQPACFNYRGGASRLSLLYLSEDGILPGKAGRRPGCCLANNERVFDLETKDTIHVTFHPGFALSCLCTYGSPQKIGLNSLES